MLIRNAVLEVSKIGHVFWTFLWIHVSFDFLFPILFPVRAAVVKYAVLDDSL